MKPFFTHVPEHATWQGGYAGGPGMNPSDLADELFGEEISGPWLTCYMLRRFGWPNEGSDNYKQLMTWTLVTPIKGLWLAVTPYLGGSNLHFAIRFTDDVGRKLDADPGREKFFKRQEAELIRWWNKAGRKLYVFGSTTADDKDETLVKEFATKDKQIYGLYQRKPHHKSKQDLLVLIKRNSYVPWFLNNFREKVLKHKLPRMTAREKAQRGNPFRRQCERAVKQTMLDLLRPTNVRDVDFNIFGRPEKTYATKPKQVVSPAAPFFAGAGNAPSYYYSKEGIKERKAKKQS